MTDYVFFGLGWLCIILCNNFKKQFLIELSHIISSDEVIMAHVNAGVLEKNLMH